MADLDPKIIKESFENVIPIADEAIKHFYQTLFEKYPDSKAFFENTDMDAQVDNLIGALMYIVDNIEKPKVVLPYLEDMGKRHVNYGVQDAHYALVGDALLDTFAHFFKEAWTEDLRQQWLMAYAVIASHMIKGMRAKVEEAA